MPLPTDYTSLPASVAGGFLNGYLQAHQLKQQEVDKANEAQQAQDQQAFENQQTSQMNAAQIANMAASQKIQQGNLDLNRQKEALDPGAAWHQFQADYAGHWVQEDQQKFVRFVHSHSTVNGGNPSYQDLVRLYGEWSQSQPGAMTTVQHTEVPGQAQVQPVDARTAAMTGSTATPGQAAVAPQSATTEQVQGPGTPGVTPKTTAEETRAANLDTATTKYWGTIEGEANKGIRPAPEANGILDGINATRVANGLMPLAKTTGELGAKPTADIKKTTVDTQLDAARTGLTIQQSNKVKLDVSMIPKEFHEKVLEANRKYENELTKLDQARQRLADARNASGGRLGVAKARLEMDVQKADAELQLRATSIYNNAVHDAQQKPLGPKEVATFTQMISTGKDTKGNALAPATIAVMKGQLEGSARAEAARQTPVGAGYDLPPVPQGITINVPGYGQMGAPAQGGGQIQPPATAVAKPGNTPQLKFKGLMASQIEEAYRAGIKDGDIMKFAAKKWPGHNVSAILNNVKAAYGR